MRTRLLATVVLALLLPGCSEDSGNPFDQFSFSRAPSEEAILFYVSGAWTEETGAPRELFAVDASGTVERLTTCTQRSEPCDFLQVSPSSNPERIIAVRAAVGGDPEASALFFIDLGRSVETVLAVARRVQGADWSSDDSIVVYSSGDVENLFTVRPNGEEDTPLTDTADFRERSPRVAPNVSGAIYEGLSESPGKSLIYYYLGDDSAAQATRGGPGTEVLPGTPYVVGSDASPAFAPTGQYFAFRRLTGIGNGGLGTWDILVLPTNGDLDTEPFVVAGGGDVYRGPPDWGPDGRLAFVETDMTTQESRLVLTNADGSDPRVLHSENAGYRMDAPRWIR